MHKPSRRSGLLLVSVVVALAIAIPALAASPSPAANPSGQSRPEATDEPNETAEPAETGKPDKAGQSDEAPEVAVTAHGTVKTSTDGQGRPTYTLTDGAKTWDLSDGPPWFWGDQNPLKAYVGKPVTVVGTTATGGTEIDVSTVDGTVIRAPGRPPWAGGPKKAGKPAKGADGAPGKTQDDTPGS